MKAFDRRLKKLEYEFGVRKETWRMVLLVCEAARDLALDHDSCVQILDEAGFLPSSGWGMVNLCNVPDGLTAKETKRFLQEYGTGVCHPLATEIASDNGE